MSSTTHTGAASELDALAVHILTDTPAGQLTVLDGHALDARGGWTALGAALTRQTETLERYLFLCDFGDNPGVPVHPLHRATFGDEYVSGYLDRNTELDIPRDDWWDACATYDDDQPTHLPTTLAAFGTPTIPDLARTLMDDHDAAVLLTNVTQARPYCEILRRLTRIDDTNARNRAVAEAFQWLASDLSKLAAFHSDQPMIVASDITAPEWIALRDAATLILPA